MPNFSTRSHERLASCHPELQLLFNEVIKDFDCSVLCGYRGEEAQQAAFYSGKSQRGFPHSKHNRSPSLAVDVAPYPIDWHDTRRFILFAGFVQGVAANLYAQKRMTHKVRWGGDWNGDHNLSNQSFYDLPHFELIGNTYGSERS